MPRVADEDVRRFLATELDPPLAGAALERRTLLAEGSIGRALWAEEAAEGPDAAADALLQAARERRRSWLPLALAQAPWAARGDFTAMLDALALKLRRELAEQVDGRGAGVERRLEALKRVEETRLAAQGNANPQLALAVLASDLETLV